MTSLHQRPRNELYNLIIKHYHCVNSPTIGDLTGLSEEALELLLKHTNTEGFKTSEYDPTTMRHRMVLATALPNAERDAIYNDIYSLPEELGIKIHLQSELSRKSLLKFLDHFNLAHMSPSPHQVD